MRGGALALVSAVLAWLLLSPGPCSADPAKGDASATVANGFARIVFSFADDIDTQVEVAGNILVIKFAEPVAFSLEKLIAGAPGYVSTGRLDPDGKGVRLALARKVTANSMSAGEKIFVDLLPDSWKGPPPGLPQDVVADLARRAREADRKAREQKLLTQPRPINSRVKVSRQPTFTRYVFALPEPVGVTPERQGDKLTLAFAAAVKFDLADVKADLPPSLKSVETNSEEQRATVLFTLSSPADVRSFRDNNNFVVDIGALKDASSAALEIPQPEGPRPPTKAEPPETVPARLSEAERGEAKRADTPAPQTAPAPPPAASDAPQPADAAKGPLAPSAPSASSAPPPQPVAPEVGRANDNLRLTFAFTEPVAAAVFRRADTLWLVFDTLAPVDLSALTRDAGQTVRGANIMRQDDFQVVRLRLDRPRLVGAIPDGRTWIVTIGDTITEQSQPLVIARNVIGTSKPSAAVPFQAPYKIHRVADPEIGDSVLVVTGSGPTRGLPRSQDFVEFRALASVHGVVVQPVADDIEVTLNSDKVMISRPRGLSLSMSGGAAQRVGAPRSVLFDPQTWGFDRQTPYMPRVTTLITLAALAADPYKRNQARLDLARFYFAKDMHAEAKGVLDLALADSRPSMQDPTGLIMRGAANVMMGRSDEALHDLSTPFSASQPDAMVWRALALAELGKWSEARQGLQNTDASIKTLPIELQRFALKMSIRVAIESKDYSAATEILGEFDAIGTPRNMEPALDVITGQIAEGLGRNADALEAYRAAADSFDRAAAAKGRLNEIALRYRGGDMSRTQAISGLESLTAIWRGDDTEVEALYLLAKLYLEEGRYRDAFNITRTALKTHPRADVTRRMQDDAVQAFDQLFLGGKADDLSALDALAIFYDFRELAPIDRRGDEMVRRLTDRLVAIDLLDQAAELLQYQVDHRLQGAARAQVATKLAMVYLTNRKPDRALNVLRTTRTNELSNELRNQRLLLEARSLSDLGRHGLALEVAANIQSRDAMRLRADILWAAHRYGEAAEQIELMYADRWKEWQPLGDIEHADMLRAGLGYALARDKIGFERFREKFAELINQGSDQRAFDVLGSATPTDSQEFRDIAKSIAAGDSLDVFLRELRDHFPEPGAGSPQDKVSREILPPNAMAKEAGPVATR
jgi:tetratricopeptide (TPR) repeat protein